MNDSDPGFNPQNYNSQQYQFNNQGFNSASALQIRLDTNGVIENFQIFLSGRDVRTIMDDNGNPKTVKLWEGEAIVNDQGYQAVMRWVHMILNSQVIQGNLLDEDYFGEYMMNLRKDFVIDMMINRKKYGIDLRNFQGLVATFMNCCYLVLTRPLFNKEREGMNNTVKVQETMQSQAPNKGFFGNIPFFGGRA